MRPATRPITAVHFGPFLANLRSGELHWHGDKLKLQEQPFKVLAMLLQRAGDVVTREELRQRLWSGDTFVDFDHAINMAIAKIREVLGDSSEEPHYIETLGRRGYRFIAPVEPADKSLAPFRRVATIPSGNSVSRHTVGRQKERTELRAAFDSALAGQGSLIDIAGEPGIGKTTLVEDFLAQLRNSREHFLLAKGRCCERLAGSEAYLPFLEALENLLRSHADIAEPKLRKLAPSWYAQLFPLSESDPSDAAIQAYGRSATQEKVKREISSFLEQVARLEPLILFFDDLHWADSSTIDLLAYLAITFARARILVIGTYRPSELLLSKHPFISLKRDLQVRGMCRDIEVEFLTTNDVEQYIDLEFPGNAFAREFATLIHSKTEGNPLFMVDLLRHLRNKNVLVKSGESDRWTLAQSVLGLTRDLPQSVRSMIEMKIGQLSDRERELLTAAAAQGYEFDSAAVARALQGDNLQVEEMVDTLSRVHGFVKRVSEEDLPDGTLTLRCRFVHVLYQNALYSSLAPTRRTALSLSLAHALESFYGDKRVCIAPQLGFLYETAREPGSASDYFLLAAQNAQRIFANQEAIVLAQRGLALLAKIPDSPERTRKELDLQVALAFSLLCTIGYAAPETGVNMAKAQQLCEQLGDTAQLFPIIFGLWVYHLCQGNMRSAREVAERLLAISRSMRDRAQIVMGHAAIAFTLQHQGELLDSRSAFEEALTYYDPQELSRYLELYKLEPGIHSVGEMVRTLCLLGFPDQARQQIREALARARRLSIPVTLAFCLRSAAMLYQLLRECEEAKRLGEECIAICEEHGIMLERAWVEPPFGWALAELGQTDSGIAHIRAGLDAQLSIGAQVARPQFQATSAEALWHAGRLDEAFQAIDNGLAVSARNSETYYDAELWRLRGEFFKMKSDAVNAESCFQKAISIAQQQAAKWLELRACMSLARLWQEQGKASQAQQLLSHLYSWFSEGFETADLREARSLLNELGKPLPDSEIEHPDSTAASA